MKKTQPILLATDGSPSAADAQREAFEIAGALEAPLLVVSVIHPLIPAMGYTAYGYAAAVAELADAEAKRVAELLASVADGARAEELECSTAVADGRPVEEICRLASEHDARLIVVGSHGWGAARRLLSGSVSTGLIHSAPCPVLVVRGAPRAVDTTTAAAAA